MPEKGDNRAKMYQKIVPSQEFARSVRVNILKMTNKGQSSHIGSCFSACDIIAVLYSIVMNVRPDNPTAPERDRFILSKGHAGAVVYATLAECGFFDPTMLMQHYQDGSIMSGHVSHKGIPGVELSTGSLGHGLAVGAGMALRAKMDNMLYRVFVVLGDGECDEGSVWEAALFAPHHQLDNLVAIVDYNKLQGLDSTCDTLDLEPIVAKWSSFGWDVEEIDGHDHRSIEEALQKKSDLGKPRCIIAHTVKGKGVSFMENQVVWHYRWPRDNEVALAMEELLGKRPCATR